MYKSVIAGYSRSPFTMARKGDLIDVKPDIMLAEVIKNLVSKTKINPIEIEDVIVGFGENAVFPAENEQDF